MKGKGRRGMRSLDKLHTVPDNQHARWKCSQDHRLRTPETTATWTLSSKKCQVDHENKDEYGESRAEYLDSWRIAPLLGLSGSSRLLQKQDRTQNTGDQVRKRQPWERELGPCCGG